MRRLAAPVLVMEAIVLILALPVAITLGGADPPAVGIGGGALIVAAVVLAGMLRNRWAYVAGSVLQLLVILTGFVVPAMYFLGVVFAALWATAIWLGSRTYEPRASE